MKISNSLIGALIISVALLASNACAEELDRIELPGAAVFPESISADAAGNLYGGSPASGGIWRIKPGDARSEQWIAPGAFGSHSTFGVLVDEKAKLLWVCSNDVSFLDIAGPGSATGSHLKGFDLASGEGKLSVALPGSPALCNDLAVGADGSVYVTNSLAPQILRLKPNSATFEVWAQDAQFTAPAGGAGLDGIAIGGDGSIYVNTFNKGELFRVRSEGGNRRARDETQDVTSPRFPGRFAGPGWRQVPDGRRWWDDRSRHRHCKLSSDRNA